MQDKTALARTVVGLIAGRSVGNVVTRATKNLVLPSNRIEKIELAVGTFVLSGMVASKAIAWTHEQFDETVDAFRAFTNRTEEETLEEE